MKSAWFILSALVAGMLLGIGVELVSPDAGTASLPYIEPIGLLWLNALKMTIVPLVVALLITGITATADAARAGKLAFRAVMIFLGAITLSGLMSLLMTPLLLRLFPLSTGAADALRHGLGGTTEAGPSPTFGDFLLSLIPTNPIAAAAETAILPLIVFTTIFAFAITKLEPVQRATLSGLFKALGDAMLIVIGWVLALAPIGVFALGYALAVKAGIAAFGGLIHYVLILSSIGISCLSSACCSRGLSSAFRCRASSARWSRHWRLRSARKARSPACPRCSNPPRSSASIRKKPTSSCRSRSRCSALPAPR